MDGRGFAFSERPVSITGYFQFFPATSSGDRFFVGGGLYKGGIDGIEVGGAGNVYSNATSGYTMFIVPFTYLRGDIPDTCVISITIVGPGTGPQAVSHAGSYYLLDDLAFSNAPVTVKDPINSPAQFSLQQNYPNPFNPSTTIQFSLPKATYVTLNIYNTLGQEVAQLLSQQMSAGTYTAEWNALGFASGVYYYRIEAGSFVETKKLVLLR